MPSITASKLLNSAIEISPFARRTFRIFLASVLLDKGVKSNGLMAFDDPVAFLNLPHTNPAKNATSPQSIILISHKMKASPLGGTTAFPNNVIEQVSENHAKKRLPLATGPKEEEEGRE